MLLDWENGKEKVITLWQKMNDWAFEGYEKTYARQGLKFDKKYYESDLYKTGKEYVLEGLKKGLLKKPKTVRFIWIWKKSAAIRKFYFDQTERRFT